MVKSIHNTQGTANSNFLLKLFEVYVLNIQKYVNVIFVNIKKTYRNLFLYYIAVQRLTQWCGLTINLINKVNSKDNLFISASLCNCDEQFNFHSFIEYSESKVLEKYMTLQTLTTTRFELNQVFYFIYKPQRNSTRIFTMMVTNFL